MPYPNEHSARLKKPGGYVKTRRQNNKFGPGIHAIFGVTKEGKAELRSIHFDKSKFTVAEAKAWLKSHNHKWILFEPASGQTASMIVPDGGPFNFSGVEIETDELGVPIKRVWKDVLRPGLYTHPQFGWNLSIDDARMGKLLATFLAMRENGVDVEIVANHSGSVWDHLGYIRDGKIEDGRLYLLHEFRGDTSIKLAEVCQRVSVGINKDYDDGAGRSYGEAIMHSSLSLQTLVTEQENFTPAIAASMSSPGALMVFSQSNSGEEQTMEQLLKSLAELCGVETLTEQNAAEKVKTRIDELESAKTLTEKGQQATAGEVETLKAKLAELEKGGGGGDDKPKELDPDVEDQLVEGTESKIGQLVTAARITPAVGKKLSAFLVGKKGSPGNRLMLSRSATGREKSFASELLSILEENDPVKLKEQTGAQTFTLSRKTPGDDEEGKFDVDEEVKARVAAMHPEAAKTT